MAWRSPLRFSRCRLRKQVSDSPTQRGEGSLGAEAFGVATSRDQEGSCRVGSYTEDADQRWRCRPGEPRQFCFQVVDLLAEFTVAAGQRAKGVFAADVGLTRGPGRNLLHRATRATVDRPSRLSRSSAGAVTTRAFIWLMAWVRALTAEIWAVLSIRIISTSPWPDLGVASATPARTERAAISASVGSLFPFRSWVDRSVFSTRAGYVKLGITLIRRECHGTGSGLPA